MIEIRDFGDKKTVVAYTDEGKIASKLRTRSKLIKIVPYEQEQYSKGKVATVGFDFYFPKSLKKSLSRMVEKL